MLRRRVRRRASSTRSWRRSVLQAAFVVGLRAKALFELNQLRVREHFKICSLGHLQKRVLYIVAASNTVWGHGLPKSIPFYKSPLAQVAAGSTISLPQSPGWRRGSHPPVSKLCVVDWSRASVCLGANNRSLLAPFHRCCNFACFIPKRGLATSTQQMGGLNIGEKHWTLQCSINTCPSERTSHSPNYRKPCRL